jgi:uncharacterized protein YbjT (DUF2867 family)
VNVTVFGATGAIGQLIVAELLTAGHTVTAYVRNPGKVPSTWPQDLRVIVAEITDATGLPLVEGTLLMIEAMKRHGVERFIGNGTPSIVDKRDRPNVQQKLIGFMGRNLLSRAYQELLGMSELIMNSGVDWTIVRFSAPRDGPARGVNRYGFYGVNKIGIAVTRADIAAFTVAQLTDDRFHHAAPAISN